MLTRKSASDKESAKPADATGLRALNTAVRAARYRLMVVGAALMTLLFVALVVMDWHPVALFGDFASQFETVELDEIPLILIVALAVFSALSWRRWQKIEASRSRPRLHTLKKSGFRDLLIACVLPAMLYVFLLIVDVDIFESLMAFSAKYEEWEIDELPFILLLALSAFSWLSWRQWRRYEHEVARRAELESEILKTRAIAHETIDNKLAFLANLSHEFRTPLNAIIGFSQMIEQEVYGPIGNEKYKDYMRTIHRSATLLNELVDNYLEIEKIETGSEEMAFKACRLPQIVDSILPIVEPAVRSAKVTIVRDLPATLPRLHADVPAMNKIVINLLTNAIKYNKHGGTVWISASCPAGGSFTLTVEDDGIGIEPDDLETILDPFQRGESPLVKSREGTGLGLNIVKRLIDQHDATITFDSTPNVGTKVVVTFPPERVMPEAQTDPAEMDASGLHSAAS